VETKKNLSPIGKRIDDVLFYLRLNRSNFAKSLNIANSYLWDLMHEHAGRGKKAKKGGEKFWDAVRSVYPEYYPYLKGLEKEPPWEDPAAYPEAPRHMAGRPAGDSGPDEAGRSDIENYVVTGEISPSVEKDIRKVVEILESPYTGVIAALRANIIQFHEMVGLKKDMEDIRKKLGMPSRGSRPKGGRKTSNG